MMDVRRMRMLMRLFFMCVHMAMLRRHLEAVRMVVMPVRVAVAVFMLNTFVDVRMSVSLKRRKVCAKRHDDKRRYKRRRNRLAEY